MAHTMGSYDESLLRDAPVATKQQMQEGYTTDLLASPLNPRSLNRTQSPLPDGATAATPPTALRGDLEQGQRSQDGFNHYTPLSEKAIPSSNKIPFFRTTKGIILIAVLVIIIVGVVVGAAVGTTVNKSQSATNNAMVSSQSSSTATNGVNPAGPNSAGSVVTALSSLVRPTTSTTTTTSAEAAGTAPVGGKPPGNDAANGYAILQSESNAIAAMKQAGHYKRRDTSQASGNVDIS